MLYKKEEYDLVANGTTNATGLASFSSISGRIHVKVEYKGKALFIPDGHLYGPDSNENVRSTIVLDKRLAKPGDTVHLKGECKCMEYKTRKKSLFHKTVSICCVS